MYALPSLIDGRAVASGSHDETVRMWDAETGEQIGDPWNAKSPVLFLAFSPDNTHMLSALVLEYHR